MNYLSLEEKLKQIRSERDSYKNQIVNKDDTITKLESSLSIFKIDRDKFIYSQNLFVRQVYELQKHIRQIKEDFLSNKREVKSLLENRQSEHLVFSSKIKTTLDQIQNYVSLKQQHHQDELNKVVRELTSSQMNTEEKERQRLDNVREYEAAIERNRGLIQDNNQLEHQLSDVTSSATQKDELIQILKCEIDQLRLSKNQHINDIKDEIEVLKSEKKLMERSIEEMKIAKNEMQSSLSSCETEIQRLRSTVQENDRQLQSYRDAMIQNEERLKELSDQIKLLTKDRDRQSSQHETEISKLLNELKTKESTLEHGKKELEQSFLAKITQKEAEIEKLFGKIELQQKVMNGEAMEKEKSQKAIRDLENENKRLLQKMSEQQKLIDSKFTKSVEVNESLQMLEKEIQDKETLIDKMEGDLICRNNEITNLKQMVQKECEERFELTEALNQAREQLLSLGEYHVTKIPNSLPPINHTKSTSSSASDKRSGTFSLKEKRNSLEKMASNSSKNSIISTKRKLERLFNT